MNPQPLAPQLPYSQVMNYQNVQQQIPNIPAASKKRRASKACVYCNRSHMSCEDSRPCKRCIDRGIAHLCKDTDTGKRRGRKGTYLYDYGDPQTPSPIPDTPAPLPVSVPTATPVYSVTTLHSSEPLQAPVIDLPIDFLSLFSFQDSIPSQQECSTTEQEAQFQKDMEKLLEIINKRAPDYVQIVKERVYSIKDKITKYYKETRMMDIGKIDHKQMIESTKAETSAWIKKYEQMFENLAIPVFVFDRTSAIRYVNPAYKALSGFNKPLPSEPHQIYVDLFSPSGMKSYMDSMFNFLENFASMLNSTGFMFKSSIRVHDGTNVEKSCEGTMVINFRRDAFDFPFLYLGSFLPADLKRTLTFQPIIPDNV